MDDIRIMMDYDEVSVYFTKPHFLPTEGPLQGLMWHVEAGICYPRSSVQVDKDGYRLS